MVLSPKRRQILDFITRFFAEHGYSPSVRDVARGCGISSSSVAQYHLKVLEDQGYIHRDRDVSRGIGLPSRSRSSVMLLGTIAAGKPIPVPAAESWTAAPEDYIELPEILRSGSENVYALKVKGTSMIDALIDDGDIVIMQATNTAQDGDTVAVWLKDRQEVTLKKIYRLPDQVCLKPANKGMKPIYCRPEDIEIQGKVIGIMRKL